MDGIKKCNGVILLICNDYFFSINCMYEGITAMKDCKNKTIIRIGVLPVNRTIKNNKFLYRQPNYGWRYFYATFVY